ncbi:efflux RND transporter periplasmic adaptor subunit [Falsirhodobacter sp. 20TX0035]|uniref:efflux RND transporter periplasmic adaptor subunit n=1 Tax=Falsirhodobacter sp. 20TX0035 TaxID=3022019 RepID=UPI00232E9DFA|nr:efflux RND transporter periplasmic adaptor subunit [Falsirhodobacter sp. 20TX0035]MDB6453924.1 efflux RND transporter periplasmic adaptor subunit [Falsirhodobacter sp. 20TX0035]
MARRRLWMPALAVAAALGGAVYLWQDGSGDAAIPPATYAVKRGDVSVNVLASGQIESSSLVSVGARVSGEVEELAVTLGQTVQAGDLIARIDSRDQQNAVARAKATLAGIEAQIASAEATLVQAQQTYDRSARLSRGGSLTVETFEQASADLAIAKASLDQLQASRDDAAIAVSDAEVELERTRITAPMAGTVVAVVTKAGQTVNANQSTPTIVKLADLENMVVNAEISEADVVRVAPGQDVTFTILGAPDRTFQATVRQIEPAPAGIEESDTISSDEAIYYNGLFDVENPDGVLRIGMTAEVRIALQGVQDVLTLPSAALGQRAQDGTYTVQVQDGPGFVPRPVTVGLNDNVTAEITGGVKEGDRILASGAAEGLSRGTGGGRRGPMGF